jgi:hypothetical protein
MNTSTRYVIATKGGGYMGAAQEWRNVPFEQAALFIEKSRAMSVVKEGDNVLPVKITID